MLAKLQQTPALFTDADAKRAKHVLVVLSSAGLAGIPHRDALEGALKRRRKKLDDLKKSPLSTESGGALVSWLVDDPARPAFERQTAMRKALQPLLAEQPAEIAIAVFGESRAASAGLAVYTASVNGVHLPVRKKKNEAKALETIRLYGHRDPGGFADVRCAPKTLSVPVPVRSLLRVPCSST